MATVRELTRKIIVRSVIVNGIERKTISRKDKDRIEDRYEFETQDLLKAGWIRVTHCGDENLYFDFTDDSGVQHKGYCKCL